jgi:hypothetical protein
VTLRAHRRNVVIWSSSGDRAGGSGAVGVPRPARTGPLRRLGRTGALLTLLGLVRLVRGLRRRWRPLLAGVVLTTAGFMLRSTPWGVVFVAGLWFFVYAMFIPGGSERDRARLADLRRELAAYSTPAQRCDLEALLDRYPDDLTRELRNILADQAMAAGHNGIPGAGRG